MNSKKIDPTFSTLLRDFFVTRLQSERNVSQQTIASYRDTFRLFLAFARDHLKKPPSGLEMDDLTVSLVSGFLDHLEKVRKNSIRTRNARLAAIRSFMNYASLRQPASLPTVQRVLAIPMKRFERPVLGFLSRPEMEAILEAPDRRTWSGRRDHVMFALFYNTGARVSEVAELKIADVSLQGAVNVRFHGKGRKERVMPLWKNTTRGLREWLTQIGSDPASPVFPNRKGKPLSRSGIEHRLEMAVEKASQKCPSLKEKNVSPHTLRHTTAMHLLQSGVDLTTIALWLGHESPSTTHGYIEADLQMKELTLNKLPEAPVRSGRYRASDSVLAFLESL